MDSDRQGSAGGSQEVGGVAGVVTELLPHVLYRVRLDGGQMLTAHIADRMDRNFIRVLVGDRVRVQLSPVDRGRGRIVAKD